jgi:hypothetical protein
MHVGWFTSSRVKCWRQVPGSDVPACPNLFQLTRSHIQRIGAIKYADSSSRPIQQVPALFVGSSVTRTLEHEEPSPLVIGGYPATSRAVHLLAG